jgi:outer membrane protein insertion porin family
MKTDDSVSISGSGNGIKRLVLSLVLVLISSCLYLYGIKGLEDHTVSEIYFKFQDHSENSKVSKFQPLLHFKSGDSFNYKRIRKSVENLYKIGAFANIETRIQKKADRQIDIHFVFTSKYTISTIKLIGRARATNRPKAKRAFKKKELKNAIFSIREDTYFEEENIEKAIAEAKRFFISRGFFNPDITSTVIKNQQKSSVAVKLMFNPRIQTEVNRIDLEVSPQSLTQKITPLFNVKTYVPETFNERIEEVKKFLKKKQFYFPEIKIKEEFLDKSKALVRLKIKVDSGYRYNFLFNGMKPRIQLISTIWKKKVFEKWAEKESNARILYFLKNKGFLNAQIQSNIEANEEERIKTITFRVKKNEKYKLGHINLKGNRSISEKELRKVIKSDTTLFNKFFHLRLKSILVDREILRLLYYFQGFPNVQILTQPNFPKEDIKETLSNKATKSKAAKKKVDIAFIIEEGKRFTVDSILFEGNHFFTTETLQTYMQTRNNGPFVQQHLNEDLEKIHNLYLFYGYDNIKITPEVSQSTEKSILIRIEEGQSFRMGNLIVIGASKQQRILINKLFPIKKDQPFDRLKIDTFERDIENSAVFSQFRIVKIERPPHLMDVLIKVTADYSRYYGFGVGWEGRKDGRVTLEYQGKNVFRSYSTFSALLQYGTNEQRGVLSYDTPYFFKTRINSSLKTWIDSEVYPSYEFNRFGIGESLIKKLTPDSYILASLSWYRTELTELEISPKDVDQLNVPFDTTAFNFSYVREKRDDPFNPTSGSFFSSDLKIGFPLFEKDYTFLKFHWSYQHNFKFLKNGVFALSLRNGLASGELSITERFFAGGVNSYRGTRKDRLGPIDPLTDKPKGGNALVLFNLEATFPIDILPISDFYYSVFADIGDVFDRVKNIDLQKLGTSIGISLKYKTGMGPLRFDLAWDLGERFTWGNFKFHIGIGNVF